MIVKMKLDGDSMLLKGRHYILSGTENISIIIDVARNPNLKRTYPIDIQHAHLSYPYYSASRFNGKSWNGNAKLKSG